MNTIEQIRNWCKGNWLLTSNESQLIENLVIDTRNIIHPENSLFIALKSKVRDGHSFIMDAYLKGVRNFLVSQHFEINDFPESNIILVLDTLIGLQQIAEGHRKKYLMPVIGITGSNGKTIIKEWLYQLLGNAYHAVRSPQSYNSQIGVPLSVWMMNASNKLCIFEAGISQPGEMEQLKRIIHPTIGIFTNIGEAHSEGFMNARQKINEKLILFRNANQLIYCKDHLQVHECIMQYMHHVKNGKTEITLHLFTWAFKQDADLKIVQIVRNNGKSTITGCYKNKNISIKIPFIDDASIENAIHCWCVALMLNRSEGEIEKGMAILQPISMRMELKQGINDCSIINDAYNSDLTSLQYALQYLKQQQQQPKHTLILSDLLEVGKRDIDIYEEVANLLEKNNLNKFIGIGVGLYKNKSVFRKNKKMRSIFFKTTTDFLKNFHLLTFEKEAILLKGARIFTFEKIAVLLEQKIHQTILTINLSAIRHNLDVFRKEMAEGVKTMAMVKAYAYGNGSYEIANLLQNAGVDYLTVAYTDEGVGLRKAGIKMPIMVMNPDTTSFHRMIAWRLEPEIYSFLSFERFKEIAEILDEKDYPIHIKLDTGMHRLGFNEEDIEELIIKIMQCSHLKVMSIFSHLVASEDKAQNQFTKLQAERFVSMSGTIIKKLGYKPLLHLSNSSGIVLHKHLHFDMVRLGLGLYGVDGTQTIQNSLKQISTLKTIIAQIRNVSQGESVGYGRKAIADTNKRIATICIGYADGYPRTLGYGYAYVLIKGKKANTVGSICMDMCMVDITSIPEANEGDEVTVFGEDLPVSQLAHWASTISYEILTNISQRVKRVYLNE